MNKRKIGLFKNVIIFNNFIRIYGKNIQDNFSFELNKDQIENGVSIDLLAIKKILYVKPAFTKGYFEILYKNNRSRDVWFQIRLTRSWWVSAEMIVENARVKNHSIKIIDYVSTKEWKDREAKMYFLKKKK